MVISRANQQRTVTPNPSAKGILVSAEIIAKRTQDDAVEHS